jgi:hypothetical protein
MTKNIIEQYDTDNSKSVDTEEQLKSPKIKSFVATPESVDALKADISIASDGKESVAAPIMLDVKPPVEAPKTNEELNTDYQYIRNNLYTITERAVEALNNLVQIADQSQHPRAYEVVALMVNSIASAQKDLMNIHKERAKIDGISAKSKPDVVNNNLFVGNTAQLDEIIKQMSKTSTDE